MKEALSETERRRERQHAHNTLHGITPKTISRGIMSSLGLTTESSKLDASEPFLSLSLKKRQLHLADLRQKMLKFASDLEFEEAGRLRDEIHRLETLELTTD
jgi:excinuclease ABC subunit B